MESGYEEPCPFDKQDCFLPMFVAEDNRNSIPANHFHRRIYDVGVGG
jgi:hypothetical protein